MNTLKSIKAKEILDSQDRSTVQVELETERVRVIASVPSGVSTGKYEAVELRDKDGQGVKKALENIRKIISPVLAKEDLSNQKRIDGILLKLDGTENKSRLGANAILAVSVACCRASAADREIPLYRYIADLAENGSRAILPKPSFNLLEGGKHSEAELAFQEFMIIPQKNKFSDNFKIGKQIYTSFGKILEKKFGKKNMSLSKEGAFFPPVKKVSEVLDLIKEALAGVSDVKIAIDAAASEFYQDRNYGVDGQVFSAKELAGFYSNLVRRYPITLIEDPFDEEDYGGWEEIRFPKYNGRKSDFLIFGDDLTVTNIARMKMAKEKKLCNGVIIKPNQIGTVTETLEAARLAKSYGWKIMVANRAGETMDDFIADLAVGIGADFIKSGAPFPKERLAKYNRLLKIEKEIKNE